MKIAGYTPIKTGAGRPLLVRKDMQSVFERVFKEYRSDYHMTSIMRTLMSLNSDALRGKSLNPAGDERSITSGHISMKYSLFNGSVLINILAIGKPQPTNKTGLYTVEFDSESLEWTPKRRPIKTLHKSQQWKSQDKTAHYAAVAGKFDRTSDAASRMPEHIIGGYEKAHYLTRHDKGNQYSLFWVEKGAHKSKEAAESLASIMQQSTKNNLPVNWLIHGEGIHAFKNAAKLIQAAPLAYAAERAKDPSAGKAQNQHVYFSNPASSDSEKALTALCSQAGFTFAGLNPNNRDLRRWSTLKNVGREVGKVVGISVVSGGGALSAGNALSAVGAGGADKVVANGMDALLSGNYFAAAACVVGAGVIVVGARKNIRAMGASIKCTLGKGNERWYTGDAALLS